MASRLECSRLAGDSLVWQTLQLESGRVPLSDSCQYLLSRRSTFTCSSLRTCKLQTQDLLCSVIVMESFISRLEQKGFIVSFNPKGDGSCFFSAAACTPAESRLCAVKGGNLRLSVKSSF